MSDKTQEDSIIHIGPMSQDFYSAFQLGVDNKGISTIDSDGIALASIQALNTKIEDQQAQIKLLSEELASLKSIQVELDDLKQFLINVVGYKSLNPNPPAKLESNINSHSTITEIEEEVEDGH